MSTVKIGVPNWAEPNWAALSLGGWGATSTLDNLKSPDFGLPAVSTDATAGNTQFAIDFSALSTVLGHDPMADCLFIPKHNLTASATIRVMGGSAAFTAGGAGGGTIAYDSTAITALTATLYPSAQRVAWATTGSGAADAVMDGAYNRGVLVNFGAQKIAKYWWVGIADTGNPAGVISLGRVFLGPLYQPSYNFAPGVSLDFEGQLVSTISRAGAEFIDPGHALRRIATLTFNDLAVDEAMSQFLPLQMYLGYDKQALFLFDPSDTAQQPRRQFMVTLRKPGAIAFPRRTSTLANTALTFAEVI